MTLSEISKLLQQKRGRKLELENSIEDLVVKLKKQRRYKRDLEKAYEILKQVGLETQQQLVYHISDVTSIALSSVFDEPYKVNLNFVDKRGKTECDIVFEKNGVEVNPMLSSGGGVIDIASFALRIASWSMKVPNTRSIVILDEPFKHLSKGLHNRASEMIKLLSDKLNLQFIIVTHESSLGMSANRIFEVKQRKGISSVKQLT